MDIHERMEDAEDRLEGWIKNAVEEAQREVFGEEKRIDDGDLQTINEVDEALKKRGDDGLWGSVHYRIYTEENDEGDEIVSIDTFGVPMIPPDVDVEMEKDRRETYNDILSDYGVAVSQKVEEQFEEWRSERREQA